MSDAEKLNYMLNHQYKLFAHYLVDAWNIRATLMYISDDVQIALTTLYISP